MTQLSTNFTLAEMVFSDTAQRRGIDNGVRVGWSEHRNLERLCLEVLQPARSRWGPLRVFSGYRCAELNALVGGQPDSQHMLGLAGDVGSPHFEPLMVARWMEKAALPFDQLIVEHGLWVHASVAPLGSKPRREVLTAVRFGGRTHFVKGLMEVHEALGLLEEAAQSGPVVKA